jgi:predicted HicB family RNase H-like nuclease
MADKDKKTMVKIAVEVRDQAKIAAVMTKQNLESFVDTSLRSAIKKVMK